MRRRDVLLQSIVAMLHGRTPARAEGKANPMDDFQKRLAEINAAAVKSFPFKLVAVPGKDALAEWERLKSSAEGTPVVLGDDEAVSRLSGAFDPLMLEGEKPVAQILEAATRIKIPDDLLARREKEDAESKKYVEDLLAGPDDKLPKILEIKDADGKIVEYVEQWFGNNAPSDPFGREGRVLSMAETRAHIAKQLEDGAKLGAWPDGVPQSSGLTVATDLTGKPLEKVYIALIPTKDWTEIPAHLRWGGWNDCPDPEYHVAALRSWRDRYGVELIGVSGDTLNLRASRRPATHEEAIALAREQYAYCTDIIEQGVQTLSVLAATLYYDNWWFFWWD
jgi:hypothetical protein